MSRPLYGLERVFLLADRLWPPFVNQLVVEGEGELDPERWRAALTHVTHAWPAACIRLGGVLGWTRWSADGRPPALVEVTQEWDGRGPAPFTEARLDPVAGPVVQVVLTPSRVLIRTHHAAFDGGCARAFAADLFAALEGRPVRGGTLDGPSDVEIARGGVPTPEPPPDRVAPTGPSDTSDTSSRWCRVSVRSVGGRVLARVLTALAEAARDFTDGPLRVSVPVDLRRHGRADLCGNVTGFVRVDLVPDADAMSTAVAAALAAKEDLSPVLTADRLRWIPLWALEGAARDAARETLTTGRCNVSATVSNLGRMDLGALSGGGFRATAAWWIPPSGPGTPLFMTVTGHDRGIEICGGMPVGFASGGRLERLLAGVAERLTAGETTAAARAPSAP